MKYHNPAEHPCFPLLLVWRGILVFLVLHAVVDKPFEAMLMALGVLGLFALSGEFVYAWKLRHDNERLRQQAEHEARERRAEEARLRFEASRAAQEKNGRKRFSLDDDDPPAIPEPQATELETLSAGGGGVTVPWPISNQPGDSVSQAHGCRLCRMGSGAFPFQGRASPLS